MYCSKCGKETADGSSFCASCGNNLNKENLPLYDLKPKKTAWQAILLYLSALAIQFLSILLISVVIILTMQALGIKINIPDLKVQAKKWGVLLNPVFAIAFACLIMKVINIFHQKRAIIFTVISAVVTFLVGSPAGFIFVAIMTRFKPEEQQTEIVQNS